MDGRDGTGEIEGSTRGPRGPKKTELERQELVIDMTKHSESESDFGKSCICAVAKNNFSN